MAFELGELGEPDEPDELGEWGEWGEWGELVEWGRTNLKSKAPSSLLLVGLVKVALLMRGPPLLLPLPFLPFFAVDGCTLRAKP